MIRRLLTVLGVLLFVSVASAGDVCRRGFYPGQVFHQTYNYTPTYYATETYHEHVDYVPFAIKLHDVTYLNEYASVQDYYRDSLLADAIAYRLLSVQSKPAVVGSAQQAPYMPEAEQAPLPTQGAVTQVSPALRKAVQESCLRCHGQTPTSGAHKSFSQLETLPPGLRWEMHGRVAAGNMPPSGKELTDQTVVEFYNFALSASGGK